MYMYRLLWMRAMDVSYRCVLWMRAKNAWYGCVLCMSAMDDFSTIDT